MPGNAVQWFWWVFSTVVVAVLVNLASAWVEPLLSRYLDRHAVARKLKSAAKQREFEDRVAWMLADPTEVTHVQSLRTSNFIFMTLCASFFSITSVILADLADSPSPELTFLFVSMILISTTGFIAAKRRGKFLSSLTSHYRGIKRRDLAARQLLEAEE